MAFSLNARGELRRERNDEQKNVVTLHDYSDIGTDFALRQYLGTIANSPIDLSSGKSFQLHAVKQTDGEFHLLFLAHHIVVDLWAFSIVIRDIMQALADDSGKSPDVGAVTYDQFVCEQTQVLQTQGEQLRHQWAQYGLKHVAPLNWPALRARPDITGDELDLTAGAFVTRSLGLGFSDRLAGFIENKGISRNTFLLGCFALTLTRLFHQREVMIGVPVACNLDSPMRDTVGCFVNTLPLVVDCHPASDAIAFFTRLQTQIADAVRDRLLPFSHIGKAAGLDMSGSQRMPVQNHVCAARNAKNGLCRAR